MGNRYFVDSEITESEPVLLSGQEARHLSRVMRAAAGDEVTLFDGGAAEFLARVSAVTKSEVQLEIVERREISREAGVAVTLAVALPKGDRQRWLVEKATELGVRTLTPLVAEHGVAVPKPQALARLERAVIEASKQCGRNQLMRVAAPATCGELFQAAPCDARRWFAHPTASASLPTVSASTTQGDSEATSQSGSPEVWLAIGPEGGFSQSELEAAESFGWLSVRLGARTLRTETAAIALAAHAILSAE